MTDLLLAIDQGTSLTKCVAVDRDLVVRGRGSRAVARSHPRPGWVEQDPNALVDSVVESVHETLRAAGSGPAEVAAIAIANQTETFVVWERGTGRPVYPAIVWQCRRSAELVERLRAEGHAPEVRTRTGLELDSTFPASKLVWVLDNVAGARSRAAAGELMYGDVASWLIWNLSGRRTHVTDSSNLSRSMLAGLESLDWDPWLLELFGIPERLLPEPRPCAAVLAETDVDAIGFAAPIVASLGDQQASLFGQRCWRPGLAKITLGSGGFAWVNAGGQPPLPAGGLLASCAWSRADGEATYALEGFVADAGTAVQWLVDVGVIDSPSASEPAVAGLRDWGAVSVPAFAGLGTPHWDPDTRGSLLGLAHGMSKAEIVAAVLDGVAHQVADVFQLMREEFPDGLAAVKADGGMSENSWLLQRIADLSGARIERSAVPEATAMGAAMLGLSSLNGWRSPGELNGVPAGGRSFEPGMPEDLRSRLRGRWERALALTREWSG